MTINLSAATITYTDTANDDTFANRTGTASQTQLNGATFGISGGSTIPNTTIGTVTYNRALTGTYGTLYLNASSGAYVFVPNDPVIEGLTSSPASQVFTITATGTRNGTQITNTANLTVSLTGVNDTPLLAAVNASSLVDTATANDTFADLTGTLGGSDRDSGQTLTYGVSGSTTTNTTIGGITYNLLVNNANGILYLNSTTGQYRFVPNAAAINALRSNATATFTFTLSDGVIATPVTRGYTINITGVNDAPTLEPVVGSYADTAAVDTFTPLSGNLVGGDRDNTTLTFGLRNAAGNAVAASSGFVSLTGTYGTLRINTSTGAYTYTPNNNAINAIPVGSNPNDRFTITLSDGSTVTTSTFTVNLTGANDVPAGTSTAVLAAGAEDTAYTINAATLLQGFTDVDGDLLSVNNLRSTNGTVVANNNGTYTFTPSSNFNGTVNLFYNVSDGKGSLVGVERSFLIAAVNDAPTNISLSASTVADNIPSAIIGFLSATDVDFGELHTYTVDDSRFEVLNGQLKLKNGVALSSQNLPNGQVTIAITARDLAGLTYTKNFTIKVAPDTTADTPILTLATDSGSSDTDKVTNSGVVDVSGLEPGATWQYSFNSGQTWINGAGTRLIRFEDGVQNILIRQTDKSGNTSTSTPTPFIFTLDTLAFAPTLALATDSGRSSSDRITNSGVVNLDRLEDGATWQYSIDNGTNWINGAGRSFTLTGDGDKNILVRQTDRAGNTSPLNSFTFTLDTIAQTPTVALATDSGSSNIDTITRSGVVNLTGLETGATWQYSLDNGTSWLNGTGSSLTLTGNGAKSVLVRQTDAAGNISAPTTTPLTFTLDSTVSAPVIALATDSGSSNTDRNTSAGVVSVTGLETGATWQYSINNGQNWIDGVGADFTLTGDGAKSVLVRQTDIAGNTSTSASLAFTVDTIVNPPSVALSTDSGISSTDGITRFGGVTVSGLETGATWQYSIDNGTSWIVGVGTSFTLTGDETKGTLVRQTDRAGNISSSTSYTFTLDTAVSTPPANAYTATSISGMSEAGATVFLATTSTATPAASATASSTGAYTLSIPALGTAVTTYSFYARDLAGNTSTPATGAQRVVVGTGGNDSLTGLGGTNSDILVGGAGTDTVRYSTSSGAISLTSQITPQIVADGTLNISTAKIDVLTGCEALQIATSGYTSTTNNASPGSNQLQRTIQTSLENNAIAAFVGTYSNRNFRFESGTGANATLIAYDSNVGSGTNYEAFLVLGKTNTSGSINLSSGVVTLSNL